MKMSMTYTCNGTCIETEAVDYYQIRRGMDDRILTCFRNKSVVGLGIGVVSKDLSWWSIEESNSRLGYFKIRCKSTPNRLLTDKQTN